MIFTRTKKQIEKKVRAWNPRKRDRRRSICMNVNPLASASPILTLQKGSASCWCTGPQLDHATRYGELYRMIYSFHVPLFLLFSGTFFNPSASFWHIVRTRANALLKPHFATLTAVANYLSWFASKTSSPYELFSAIVCRTSSPT